MGEWCCPTDRKLSFPGGSLWGMRKPLIVVLLLAATVALAQGITLNGTPQTLMDCPADGGAAIQLTAEPYVLRTATETVWVCMTADAGACTTATTTANAWPAGTVIQLNLLPSQVTATCKSAGATGDLFITRGH